MNLANFSCSFIFICSFYFQPAKLSELSTQAQDYLSTNTTCDKKVKYVIKKIRSEAGEDVRDVNIQIIVNPIDSTIRTIAETIQKDKKPSKKDFIIYISKIDCHLSENAKVGDAKYTCHLVKPNGEKTPFYYFIVFERKNISVISSPTENKKDNQFYMVVDKWEIVE